MRGAFLYIGLSFFFIFTNVACFKQDPATLKLCGETADAQVCTAGSVCVHGSCRHLCSETSECPAELSCVDSVCVRPLGAAPKITEVLGDGELGESTLGSILVSGEHLADATFILQDEVAGFGLSVISQESTRAHLRLPADVRSGAYLLMATNESGTVQESFSLNLPELSGDELLERLNRANGQVALSRLPLGSGPGQIAAGDHDHDSRYYSQEALDGAFEFLTETIDRDFLTKSEAGESFLSSAQAAQEYLPIDVAASDYVRRATLEANYLTRDNAEAELQDALASLRFGPERIRNRDFLQGLRGWEASSGALRLEDVDAGPTGRYALTNALNEYVEGSSTDDIEIDQFQSYEVRGAFRQRGLGSVGGYSLGVRLYDGDGFEIVDPETGGWWFVAVSGAEMNVENAGMDSNWVQEKHAFGFGSEKPFPENARVVRLAFALNADNGTNGNRVFQVQGIGIRSIPVIQDKRWQDLQAADGTDLSVEGFQRPQFRRIGDEVCLRGTLSIQLHDGNTQVILPEGFRPPAKLAFNRVSYDSYWKSGTHAYEHTYFTQINSAGVLKNKHHAGHSGYSTYGNLRSAVHNTHLNGICFSITP